MRSALLLFAVTVTTLPSPSLTAQAPTKVPPLTLAVGPTWDQFLTGLHLRAEYHLLRDRWFGFRVEAGGRWTPTQSFSGPSILYGDGSRYQGTWQFADVSLGLAATLTPLPRGRVSPYLVTGVAAVQTWSTGQTYYTNPQGGLAHVNPPHSGTHGQVAGFGGLGIRVHLGHRPLQVELRRFAMMRDFTIGTSLRF